VIDSTLADSLNRHCHCINVDHGALQASLETRLGGTGAFARLRESHPHLLADSPVFISHDNIDQMQAVIAAIGRVAALQSYQDRVLDWAPDIAAIEHGPLGVFFGFDFHLTNDGPQLIEVNTNAGGALLLLHVASAQQACCSEVENFVVGRVDIGDLEHEFVAMFRNELEAQSPGRTLSRVAIVDENPGEQYLSPEFELFRQMFNRHGVAASIAGPDEFKIRNGLLLADGHTVDLVYNRLTDFYLQSDSCAVLSEAYRSGAAVFTPNPRMHALYANKRNLTVLSDVASLAELGVERDTAALLASAIPRTELVTPGNADDLWERRRQLFFKPNQGFGSRGAYSGAKLTKKTWATIAKADYIAQELVAPSERLLIVDGNQQSMKLDVRCYVYNGEIQLLGARLYRGQTTNFRTGGGGLAAVFTTPAPRVFR
jgi:hypothetical protein